ncbi:TIGR03862 family flavoprotein [Thiomicrorhabdus aquaedulcis]|uniref:TIGR03862 family flavoprotein n=1 Tax=Thiomicrorhabdus aquaedulcis TaxID=2211106 RepID=UPI001E489BC7|nr:TIGR03862 family flavoprotein [Thiomicrorhabdus aquaedulcis]
MINAREQQHDGEALTPTVAIIGAGPAGLMAAECLAKQGVLVTVFDAMPSAGRKLLQAGRGGLNLTHSEAYDQFVSRYGDQSDVVNTWLHTLDANGLRQWASELGIETFIGSSGRVYPTSMQAAPLLRAWLTRLRGLGVQFAMRHRWQGWSAQGELRFLDQHHTPARDVSLTPNATVLALGGASWARLGSNGLWAELLSQRGVALAPFKPSNGGFNVGWSSVFAQKFAGQPIKNVALSFTDHAGKAWHKLGEAMITQHGLEGSAIYALSAPLRESLLALNKHQDSNLNSNSSSSSSQPGLVNASLPLWLDLMPDKSPAQLQAQLLKPRGKQSLSSFLKRAGLNPVQIGLLREVLTSHQLNDMPTVARTLKALPLPILSPRPMDEAISTAGGVLLSELTEHLMLKHCPGVFCTGEMLDWEVPTGGYLLTAVLASAQVAAQGVLEHLN